MKKILKGAILLFFIGLIFILVFDITMRLFVRHRKEVMVPDLVGKSVNYALDILSKNNLYIKKVGQQYNEKIPEGSIITQMPFPGSVVKEGKIIKVVISSGGRVVFVPNLIEKSIREARIILRQAGLILGEIKRVHSSEIRKDYVISQDPLPEEIVDLGSIINLAVSKGPAETEEITLMPNLVGKNIRQIKRVTQELNIGLGEIKTTVSDNIEEGTILKQTPPPGEIIDEAAVLNLIISKKSSRYKVLRKVKIYYEVTQAKEEKEVKIVVIDDIGEREIYKERVSPGTKISLDVEVLGNKAEYKVFLNEILVKQEWI